MSDRDSSFFDQAEYEEQKFEELRPFMLYAGVVVAVYVLAMWGWDRAIDPVGAVNTLKWRVLMFVSFLVFVSGYLYLRLPRKWYVASVLTGMIVISTAIGMISSILSGSAFYFAGGMTRGLGGQLMFTLGLGRAKALYALAVTAAIPFIFHAVGLQSTTNVINLAAFTVPIFALASVFIIFFDVLFRRIYTARKQLMAEKIRAEQATLLKNQFLSLVSHDLKGPLTVIRGAVDLILEGHVRSDDAPGMLEQIKSSTDSMLGMIDNLLNIGRLHTGVLKPEIRKVSVHAMVAEKLMKVYMKAAEKGIAVKVDVPEGAEVYADEALLGEVLFNLIHNAIKFTPPGGSITICQAEKNSICVRNTGAGIPEELLPNLFRHDVKTSSPGTHGETGTGFGLPMSHDIVRAHGGELVVKNESGVGVTFSIRLPGAPPLMKGR